VDAEFPVNATIARVLQGITSFVMTGSPTRNGVPYSPAYDSRSSLQDIGFKGLEIQVVDEAASARCACWQHGLLMKLDLLANFSWQKFIDIQKLH
jgi:hypothetical protein